jgi:hypothetical protein
MPKIARHKFDLIGSMVWYANFLRTALENRGAPTGDGSLELFRSQKARSLNALRCAIAVKRVKVLLHTNYFGMKFAINRLFAVVHPQKSAGIDEMPLVENGEVVMLSRFTHKVGRRG